MVGAAAGMGRWLSDHLFAGLPWQQVVLIDTAQSAALLAGAGVTVAITHFDSHNARVLQQAVGTAVSNGLDRSAALAAVTTVPAEVFGLDDAGRLAPGQRADVVVWEGLDGLPADPWEVATVVSAVWVDGEAQSLETRQTRLQERYRTLPGTPLTPLSLP